MMLAKAPRGFVRRTLARGTFERVVMTPLYAHDSGMFPLAVFNPPV